MDFAPFAPQKIQKDRLKMTRVFLWLWDPELQEKDQVNIRKKKM